MSLDTFLQLVTAVLALLAAIIGLVNRRKIHAVHVELNSRLTQLVRAEHLAGVGEGIAGERLQQQQRPNGETA